MAFIQAGFHAVLFQDRDNCFGGYISDQLVVRHRTSAISTEGAIKPPAPGTVRGFYLSGGCVGR